MSNGPNQTIKKLLPFTTALLLIVAAYVSWIFYSPMEDRKVAEQKTSSLRREEGERFLQTLGSQVKIFAFYADPAEVRRGESSMLCYGVNNAKAVEIEPKQDGVWPSQHRCVEVKPQATTTYTLIAMDGKGSTEKQALTVAVR